MPYQSLIEAALALAVANSTIIQYMKQDILADVDTKYIPAISWIPGFILF